MAVSTVWRRVYFLAPSLIGTKGADCSTQARPPVRRDALCPSTKIQKQAAFGITLGEGLLMPVQKESLPAA